MAAYQGPPPGYIDISSVIEQLGMSRQNFYQSGLVDLLDSWQVNPQTPRLYRVEDVNKLRQWLFIRRGLVELGRYPQNYPLVNEHWEAVVDSGEYDSECPKCGRGAVTDIGRVWCPVCEGKS